MKLDKKTLEEIKKIVNMSKEKKIIKPHTEAFKDFPVQKEQHKGKKKYFMN